MEGAAKAYGAYLAFTSSITFKDEIGPITVLDKLTTVPVNKWRYKGEQEIHIGPYAEDFNRAFGLGDKKYIYFIDFLGVLLGAVKELHDKMLEQYESADSNSSVFRRLRRWLQSACGRLGRVPHGRL